MSPFEELQTIEEAKGRNKIHILKTVGSTALRMVVLAVDKDLLFGLKGVEFVKSGQVFQTGRLATELVSVLNMAAGGVHSVQETKALLTNLLSHADDVSSDWIQRIIRKKLRIGVNVMAVNKAHPGLIVEFQGRLCQTYKWKAPLEGTWAAEAKLDGMRCYIHIKPDGSFATYSRSGNSVPGAENAAYALVSSLHSRVKNDSQCSDGWIFDGEMLDTNRQKSIGNARATGRKSDTLRFHIWDVFSATDWQGEAAAQGCYGIEGSGNAYEQRRGTLVALFEEMPENLRIAPVMEILTDPTPEEIRRVMMEAIGESGFEGIILKKYGSRHKMTRAKDWLKAKNFEDAEFPLLDILPGDHGKYENTCGRLVVDVNGVKSRVSGMTDQMRDHFWEHRETYWKKIEMGDAPMIRVAFQGYTPDGYLDFGQFLEIRGEE